MLHQSPPFIIDRPPGLFALLAATLRVRTRDERVTYTAKSPPIHNNVADPIHHSPEGPQHRCRPQQISLRHPTLPHSLGLTRGLLMRGVCISPRQASRSR